MMKKRKIKRGGEKVGLYAKEWKRAKINPTLSSWRELQEKEVVVGVLVMTTLSYVFTERERERERVRVRVNIFQSSI